MAKPSLAVDYDILALVTALDSRSQQLNGILSNTLQTASERKHKAEFRRAVSDSRQLEALHEAEEAYYQKVLAETERLQPLLAAFTAEVARVKSMVVSLASGAEAAAEQSVRKATSPKKKQTAKISAAKTHKKTDGTGEEANIPVAQTTVAEKK